MIIVNVQKYFSIIPMFEANKSIFSDTFIFHKNIHWCNSQEGLCSTETNVSMFDANETMYSLELKRNIPKP